MAIAFAILLQLGAATALALGLARPDLRPRCSTALLASAGVFVLWGLILTMGGDATRTLALTHAFPGLVDRINVVVLAHPIGERTASAWLWPLVPAAWLALWGVFLRLRRPGRVDPFWPLVAWAWTALVAHFALEFAAAPVAAVRPIPFERLLYPVSLVGAFLLARRHVRFFPAFFRLILLVELCRLPLAILGTYATWGEWNIGLDVHETTRFVNPLTQTEVQTTSGSRTQLGFLIWAPHAFLMPAFYVLSTGGVAFCTSMFLQYGEGAEQRRASLAEST